MPELMHCCDVLSIEMLFAKPQSIVNQAWGTVLVTATFTQLKTYSVFERMEKENAHGERESRK